MTNELFREYRNGKGSDRPLPGPLLLDEWQVQALLNIFRAAAFHEFIEPLVDAGIVKLPLPTEPRARALAAKQRQGHGPPSDSSWRGRERTTKFRSQ
ncbi:hypothetical protein MB46_10330 [Arthrobacter alpinus]|nr:hypothetical protein MB46_10330 [Arthrobacter alpinus]